MSESSAMVKMEARRRGRRTALAAVMTLGLVAVTWPVPVLPWLVLVAGTAATSREAWRWLRYRGEWGLKF